MASPGDVSPYDWLVWPEGALEHALAADTRRRDVMAYLGEKDYADRKSTRLNSSH